MEERLGHERHNNIPKYVLNLALFCGLPCACVEIPANVQKVSEAPAKAEYYEPVTASLQITVPQIKSFDYADWTCPQQLPELQPKSCDRADGKLFILDNSGAQFGETAFLNIDQKDQQFYLYLPEYEFDPSKFYWDEGYIDFPPLTPFAGYKTQKGYFLRSSAGVALTYSTEITDYPVGVWIRNIPYRGQNFVPWVGDTQTRLLLHAGTNSAILDLHECNGQVQGTLYVGCARMSLSGYSSSASSMDLGSMQLNLQVGDDGSRTYSGDLAGEKFVGEETDRRELALEEGEGVWRIGSRYQATCEDETEGTMDFLFTGFLGDIELMTSLSFSIYYASHWLLNRRYTARFGKQYPCYAECSLTVDYAVATTGKITAEGYGSEGVAGYHYAFSAAAEFLPGWYASPETKAWLDLYAHDPREPK